MVLPGILYPIVPILGWFGGNLGLWTIVKGGIITFVPLGTKAVIAAKTTTAAAAAVGTAAKTTTAAALYAKAMGLTQVTVVGGLGWAKIGWMVAV